MQIKKGSTSQLIEVFIADSADGSGLPGLVVGGNVPVAHYYRSGLTPVAIPLVTATVGTWTSGGFIEIDAANMPGFYQLGLPDAAISAGVDGDLSVSLQGATGMLQSRFVLELVDNVEADTKAVVDALRTDYTTARALALDNLDAAVSSRQLSGNVGLTPAAVDAIWNEVQAGHVTAGTFGFYLDAIVSGAGGGGLTQQQVRDSMKLAPTAGAPTAGSVDEHLDTIATDTTTDIPAIIAALNDVAATDIVTGGAIATLAGAVVNVDLVDTTTANTDMRGTDGAALAADYTAGRAANLDNLDAAISSLGVGWTAFEQQQIRSALGLTGTVSATTGAGNLDQVRNKTDSFTVIAGLMQATAVALSTQAVDAVWDEPQSGHNTPGTFGDHLDTQVSAVGGGGGGGGLTAQQVADAVWDEPTAGHQTMATTGKALTDAQAAGDPLAAAVPGAYGAGTAGNVIGNMLDATVSSRSVFDPAADPVANVTLVDTTTANTDMRGTDNAATAASIAALNDLSAAQVNAEVDSALDTAIPGAPTAGSLNALVSTNLDGTVSSRHAAGAAISAVTGAVGSVTAGVTVATNSDKTGYSLTPADQTAIAVAVLAQVIEAQGNITLKQAQSLMLSVLAGRSTGVSTAGGTFQSPDGAASRAVFLYDANGNRTSAALSPSA